MTSKNTLKKPFSVTRKKSRSVKRLLHGLRYPEHDGNAYPLYDRKMQLVNTGRGAREDQKPLPPGTKAGRFDMRIEAAKRNGGGRCYVEEEDHLGLAARVWQKRQAPVWYVRSGTGKRTRDIYFGRYTIAKSENGAYTYEVAVARARLLKAYQGIIHEFRRFGDLAHLRPERECRLPQSKESCRKIEQALLTAVNTSALIIHCCSRLIVMITLIAAAALIASYLFFTVIFT